MSAALKNAYPLDDPTTGNWTDRDNAVERRWTRLGGRPIQQADPLARLLGFRTDGVRAACERARQNGRMLKVVRYVQTPEHEAAAQSRPWN
ncbi:hypothetical protein [Streptomyces sp. NPDC059957]|uniref:hypothetical protein n=1 Tax=unclassified Streptomyces TaxID=2593676 RepID=UPI0036698FC4